MRNQRERRYSVYILGSLSGARCTSASPAICPFECVSTKSTRFADSTTKYRVDRLLYYEAYGEVSTAIAREKQLKGWKRERKIALIEEGNPQWKDLSHGWYEKPARTTFQG